MGYLDKECKGCYRLRPNLNRQVICSTTPYYKRVDNTDRYCPCINCIVKSMCSLICKEYVLFRAGYWNHVYAQDEQLQKAKYNMDII